MSLPRKKIAVAIGLVSAAAFFARVAFAQFVGPTAAPPGGNVPPPVWNSRTTGLQQTNASMDIDGSITAGGPLNITGAAQTSTVSGTLQVNTGLKLPLPSAHAGYVLTSSDNSGTATWIPSAASGGTITGSAAAGQMAYWTGPSSIAGDPLMIWDPTNKIFGVGGPPDANARFTSNANAGGNIEGVRIIYGGTASALNITDASRASVFTVQSDGTLSTGKVPFSRMVAPFPTACPSGQFLTAIGVPNNTCATPTLPPGIISGAGTTNYIVKFNPGPSTIGNSSMTDDGSLVEVRSNVSQFNIDGSTLNVRAGLGTSPATPGTYLYYLQPSNAFRAYVTSAGESSLGLNSAAFGFNTQASNNGAFAAGGSTISSGNDSFAAGSQNTAAGDYSMVVGSQNATGSSGGGSSFAAGSQNVITATNAFAAGENNTISGGGSSFVVGSHNTVTSTFGAVIGYQSSATGGPQSIVLGNGSQSNGTNSIAIGNNVRALNQSSIVIGNGPYDGSGYLDNNSSGAIVFGSNSTVPTIDITAANQNNTWGNIGIAGVTDPQTEIDMQGSIIMRGKPAGYRYGYPAYPPSISPPRQGRIYYDDTLQRFLSSENGGSWQIIAGASSPSSRRWKHDIQPLGDELTKLMLLRAVSFTWNKQFFGGKNDIGFIAEEVGKVFPELVTYEHDGSGYANSLDYSRFAPILVKVLQEQQREIDDLKTQIAALTVRVSAIEARVK